MDRDDLMTVDMAVMDFMRDHPDAPMAKVIHAAVEAAEPLIRADERHKRINPYDDYTIHQISDAARAHVLADLRAQVEALHLMSDADHVYEDGYEAAKRDVLDLIDGSNDGA